MKKIFLAATMVAALMTGCKDKEVQGCTDSTATNFNVDANVNCCCSYEGKVVFYWNEQTKNWLNSRNITTMKLYIDGNYIATDTPGSYTNVEPSCDGSYAFSFKENITSSPYKEHTFVVKDGNTDAVIEDGTCTVEPKGCHSTALFFI